MSDLENPAPPRWAGARGWHAQPIAAIAFIVAIVVGPFIGVCASWLRPSTDDRLVAIGAAVISGVLIGEGSWPDPYCRHHIGRLVDRFGCGRTRGARLDHGPTPTSARLADPGHHADCRCQWRTVGTLWCSITINPSEYCPRWTDFLPAVSSQIAGWAARVGKPV